MTNRFPDENSPDLSRFPTKVRGELRRTLHLPDEAPAPTAARWVYEVLVLRVPQTEAEWTTLLSILDNFGAQNWEQYDSYPYPQDAGQRVYHFRRQVPA